MRKDAVRNRERLIEAARERFRAGAADISLEDVAEMAGVGRSTLFRNFSDRFELIRAVQAVELDAIVAEQRRLGEDPQALFTLMKMVARLIAIYRAMDDTLLASPAGAAMMVEVTEKTGKIFADPVLRAKRAGLLREDVGIEDILMACGMIGAIQGATAGNADMMLERGLMLMLRGIAP